MDVTDDLVCLFSGRVEERAGSYVLEVPERELALGQINADEVYRVAVLSSGEQAAAGNGARTDRERDDGAGRSRDGRSDRTGPQPPVSVGDERTVDIEDIGEQGDGIARVERGFVVIVPDTEKNERVTIRISDVKENVAFADVVDREAYYQ